MNRLIYITIFRTYITSGFKHATTQIRKAVNIGLQFIFLVSFLNSISDDLAFLLGQKDIYSVFSKTNFVHADIICFFFFLIWAWSGLCFMQKKENSKRRKEEHNLARKSKDKKVWFTDSLFSVCIAVVTLAICVLFVPWPCLVGYF